MTSMGERREGGRKGYFQSEKAGHLSSSFHQLITRRAPWLCFYHFPVFGISVIKGEHVTHSTGKQGYFLGHSNGI